MTASEIVQEWADFWTLGFSGEAARDPGIRDAARRDALAVVRRVGVPEACRRLDRQREIERGTTAARRRVRNARLLRHDGPLASPGAPGAAHDVKPGAGGPDRPSITEVSGVSELYKKGANSPERDHDE